jgi:hypothetical protein
MRGSDHVYLYVSLDAALRPAARRRIPVNGPDHCWYANGRARPYERYVLGDNTTLRDGTSQKSIRWVETA